ncbi:hypothetical protein GPJ56_008931 [Histomonas meleagridis]|uniref:uncharacterized protein n=1 Tax=Histomonas meleagridis TaxID=135588 RepID=UPI00355AC76E|nr:hypothetical protein GPJ56_008931 [Histomonas meleagridis]KAH0797857.1 hypothetical protein GO595_009486 [Histomonas meleagridis]
MEIACAFPDTDIQSYAIQCIGSASEYNSSCCELFTDPSSFDIIFHFICSEDTYVSKSAMQLTSNVIKYTSSHEIRDYIIMKGIIPFLMENKEMSYTIAELLRRLCSIAPPPQEIFLNQILQFISNVFDKGASFEILDLLLESILLLLNNGTPIAAEQFYGILPQLILSGLPSIVTNSIKIISFMSNPPFEFATIFLQVLETEDLPAVTKLIAMCFTKFSPLWSGKIDVFNALSRKIGSVSFQIKVECVRAMMRYADESVKGNITFFSCVIDCLVSPEIVLDCLNYIRIVITSPLNDEIKKMMFEEMNNNISYFEDLLDGEYDEIVIQGAEFCLNWIESYENN